MIYLTAEKLQTYLTYLLPNLIFIHLIQDHLQEVIISYVKRHSRLDKQTKSFSRYGVRIWNSLPGGMPQMSKNNFKINVHNSLLRILSEENDYIDLPDLLVITENFLENSASHICNIRDCKLNWIEFIYLYLFNMFYSFSLVLLVSYLYLVKSN